MTSMILSKVSGTKYKVDKLLETDQAMNGMRTGRSKGVARPQTEYAGERLQQAARSSVHEADALKDDIR